MKKYLLNVLIGFDTWWNSIFGGDPKETISSRAGRALVNQRRWAIALCWFLDKLEKDHCRKAKENFPIHLATNEEVLDIESCKKDCDSLKFFPGGSPPGGTHVDTAPLPGTGSPIQTTPLRDSGDSDPSNSDSPQAP